jgi:hypothetical protein
MPSAATRDLFRRLGEWPMLRSQFVQRMIAAVARVNVHRQQT